MKNKTFLFLFLLSAVCIGCGNSALAPADPTTSADGQPPVGSEPVVLPIPHPVPVPPGPQAPQWLSATEATFADKIEIRWEPVSGAHYNLFRKTESEPNYNLLYTGADAAFTDVSALPGTSYRYAVSLVTAQGEISGLSTFDTGWRAFSPGCADKINEQNADNRIALFRNGFNEASAIVIRDNNSLLISGDAGRVVMLNGQRAVIGLWNAGSPIIAMAKGNTDGSIYALTANRILKLASSCTVEKIAELPQGTTGLDLTLDSSDNIYVSDDSVWDSGRIFRFTSTGELINDWIFSGNGGFGPSFKTIHWILSESVLLVADRTAHKMKKLRIENNQLVQIAEKSIAVIGEPTDIVTHGNNILLFVTANGTMHLIRYHSGFDGGAAIYTVGSNWRTRITESAIHPVSGTLYATDAAGKAIYTCPAPLFFCDLQTAAVSPTAISADRFNNLYVLHTGSVSSVTKLNSNGAHLAERILPDYESRAVTGFNLKADNEYVYLAATNGQKSLIARFNADFTGPVSYTERAVAAADYFDVAVSAGRIISEQVVGVVSGDEYLTKALFEGILTDGSKVQLPEYTLPETELIVPTSKIEVCGTETGDALYYQLAGLGSDLRYRVQLARLDAQKNTWLPIAVPAAEPGILAVRCASGSGNLFTLDADLKGNAFIAQRDSQLNEIRRWNAVRGLTSKTFAVAADGTSAFAASPVTLHQFNPPEVSTFSK